MVFDRGTSVPEIMNIKAEHSKLTVYSAPAEHIRSIVKLGGACYATSVQSILHIYHGRGTGINKEQCWIFSTCNCHRELEKIEVDLKCFERVNALLVAWLYLCSRS